MKAKQISESNWENEAPLYDNKLINIKLSLHVRLLLDLC